MNQALSLLYFILELSLGLIGVGLVIFIHELSHYAMARMLSINVEVLSYGYGPKLISWKYRLTEFRISIIPFGGYCKMSGAMDIKRALSSKKGVIAIIEEGSFFNAEAWKRLLVYGIGPLMNFFLALFLLIVASAIPVERLSDPARLLNASSYPTLFNLSQTENELKNGDYAINSGERVFLDYQDFESYLNENMGREIPLRVLRNGDYYDITLHPLKLENGGVAYGIALWQEPIIGRSESDAFMPFDRVVAVDGVTVENTYDIYEALGDTVSLLTIERDGSYFIESVTSSHLPFAWHSDFRKSPDSTHPISYGSERTIEMFSSTFRALGALLTFNFSDIREILTGPVKAASEFGRISSLAFTTSPISGFRTLIYLLAIVSVSITIANLLPIPTFDGGQILMTLIEIMIRKPLHPKAYLILQVVGMIIGYGLVVIMYALDLFSLFG